MKKTIVVKAAGLNALKQFGQNLINACNQYEEDMKKELEEKDGN